MRYNQSDIWNIPAIQQFASALTTVSDIQDMQHFLRDVLTEKELIEISARLEAAKMLQSGAKYAEIIEKTKLSSRTVARISGCIQNGQGGYKRALAVMKSHHMHTPPARAD